MGTLLVCLTSSALMAQASATNPQAASEAAPVLVIHAGAGNIRPERVDEDAAENYREGLRAAYLAGEAVLKRGGSSMDAVQTAIETLEDDPRFNAGKGAVLTKKGQVEMDASIMNGQTLEAGGVALVTDIRHPIAAARSVMNETPHVLLVGQGASDLAAKTGLEIVSEEYFLTPERKKQLERLRNQDAPQLDHSGEGAGIDKHGTVGAVALDQAGHLAAGTSTGGMANKMDGRIGDSPLIGAGTYAKDGVAAVSCTGHGEYFIRLNIARDLIARMEYMGLPVKSAAKAIIEVELAELGGEGGLIAVGADGEIALEFNTPGMFRAYRDTEGELKIKMFDAAGKE